MPKDRKKGAVPGRPRPDFPADPERSKRVAETPRRSLFWRLVRGLIVLGLLAALAVAVGSYFVRKEVMRLLAARSFSSTSFVLSRPFPFETGVSIRDSKLINRLERVGFREAGAVPQSPGEYHLTKDSLMIFLREAQMPAGDVQREELIELKLSNDLVTAVEDVKFRRPVQNAALEPEIISLLSDSSTRAVTRKRLDEFSPLLVQAVLAIEDERFYHHFGLDPVAISRAVIVNLRSGGVRQGGSTLTQQLAKNLFFSPERSLSRKALEAFAAVLIEASFTKDQILEFYLNEVFLGQEGRVAIHGFGEAALSFYGKNAMDLNLAEAATLAGMIKAPTKFSPRRFPDSARERKAVVLGKLLELEKISREQHDAALAETPEVVPPKRAQRVAPYFIDYLRRLLEGTYQPEELNALQLGVHTGLDREYQDCAEIAVQTGLTKLEKSYSRLRRKKDPLQAALVAVHPSSGEVLAWVGGRDYGMNQFDRVSQAKRQPGSAFKPFVYLTALDGSLNHYRTARTTSLLDDKPITLNLPGSGAWQPKNYEDEFRGEVTLREALAHSMNIPTINLALKVGIDSVAHTAELFGFGENLPRVPSLALGAGEVSPLEVARAYGALVNGGLLIDIQPIISITAPDDHDPIYTYQPTERRVASEAAVFVLVDVMRSVVENGTGNTVRRLGFKLPVAGKTGTTNDARDAWFSGFTPRLLTVVWVGFDNNDKTGLTGAQAAAPIWTDFMQCAAKMEPELDFVPPPGVVFKQIDTVSGLLAVTECPPGQVATELFVEGTEPVTPCPAHSGQSAPYADEFDRTAPLPGERSRSIFERLFGN